MIIDNEMEELNKILEYFDSVEYSEDIRIRGLAVLLFSLRVLMSCCDPTSKSPNGYECSLVYNDIGDGYSVEMNAFKEESGYAKLFDGSHGNPSNIRFFRYRNNESFPALTETMLLNKELEDIFKIVHIKLSGYLAQYSEYGVLTNNRIVLFSVNKHLSADGVKSGDYWMNTIRAYVKRNKMDYVTQGFQSKIEALLMNSDIQITTTSTTKGFKV